MVISYPFEYLKSNSVADREGIIKQVCDVLRLSPLHENASDIDGICNFTRYMLDTFMDVLVDMWYNWDDARMSPDDIHELFARVPEEMHQFAFEHGRKLAIGCNYTAEIVKETEPEQSAIIVQQQLVVHTPFFTINILEQGNDADGWELVTDILV